MPSQVKNTTATIVPTLRYHDAGAEVVVDIADQDHGGRMYSCRDPEGHLWNFGTYDPWLGEHS